MKKENFNAMTLALLLLFFLPSLSYGQEKTITGTVVSATDNMPLPGTSIVVKGTISGTTSDFDGNYSITANEGAVLVFSYIGFKTQEVTVTSDTVINMSLIEDSSLLTEVIVVGYGTQSRSKLTTSVAKLDTKILETSTRSNLGTALQGTIAGLRVTNTTGQPGSTPSISIRGGGNPLILIDGIPSDLYALNPDDVASVEVLKDAAASAIYGSRSADGVILITTKTGKVGKSNISYNLKYSTNHRRETPEYLSAADFIKYNRLAVKHYTEVTGRTNFDAGFLNGASAFGTGNNTTNSAYTTQFLSDSNRYLLNQPGWQTVTDPLDPTKEILFMDNDVSGNIYQQSTSKDHYLSFDGGNEKGTYYLGAGYLDNQGLILGSGFKRYSGKFTGSYKVTDNIKARASIIYTHSNLNKSPLGSDNSVFRRFAGQAPTSRTYNNNEDGTLSDIYNQGTNRSFGNPLYYQDKFIRNNIEQRLNASAGLDWDIREDLKFKIQGSHATINNHNEAFNKAYLDGSTLRDDRKASVSLGRTITNQLNATIDYTKSIKNHNFNLLLGAEYWRRNYFASWAGTKFSPTDLIATLNAGGEPNGNPTSFKTSNAIVSTFGRLNYDFDNKYLLTATFRRDGSSRLGNDKYDLFPAISAGWNVHNESFFKDTKIEGIVSILKPRISYGVTGSVESLGDGANKGINDNFRSFGKYGGQGVYAGNTGYGNTVLPTLDLLWERATTLNFGVDLGLFNNRVSILADYFIKDRINQIYPLDLPSWVGINSIKTNEGITRFKGFELQLDADVVKNDNLLWQLGVTLSHVKKFVKKLPFNGKEGNRRGGEEIYNRNTGQLEWVGAEIEGQRSGSDVVYTYIQEYIYADQAAVDAHADREDIFLSDSKKRYPGDVAWLDANGDKIIDGKDRQVIGRTTPNLVGAFTSNLKYKNFNLYIKTDFATGHIAYNHIKGKGYGQTQGNLNQTADIYNSWTPENTNTDLPRFVFVDAQKNIFRGNYSSRFWEKADYLSLREVTLSYDVPVETFTNTIKRLSLYVTGSNLHYFKSYSGDTPEKGGFQFGEFPMPRTFTLGLNLTF